MTEPTLFTDPEMLSEPPPLELARRKLQQLCDDLNTHYSSMNSAQLTCAEDEIRAQERLIARLEEELL